MKKNLFPIIYFFVLLAFTVYVLLDTFVIVRVYEPITPAESTRPKITLPPPSSSSEEEPEESVEPNESVGESSSEEPILTEPIITDHSYQDNDISVMLNQYREYDTDIYVADIKLSSPEYLKTALAKDSYGRNITERTSSMAERHGAIIAVNGDYYGAREKGYVLRNGVLYRTDADKNRESLAIFDDGSFAVVTEGIISAEALAENGAVQLISFGPGLVVNGKISVSEKDEVAVASVSNPRTAIGIIDDLHYVLIVSDGRTAESAGLSLYEMAEFMQSLGVTTGYNLDGGGSATMWFGGRIINNPTTNGKTFEERKVSDIVYIGY